MGMFHIPRANIWLCMSTLNVWILNIYKWNGETLWSQNFLRMYKHILHNEHILTSIFYCLKIFWKPESERSYISLMSFCDKINRYCHYAGLCTKWGGSLFISFYSRDINQVCLQLRTSCSHWFRLHTEMYIHTNKFESFQVSKKL